MTNPISLLLLLLASWSTGDEAATEKYELRFHPPVGSAYERKWESEHDLLSESMLSKRGEQVLPIPGQMRLRSKETLDVIDHLRAIEGGRVTDLRRTFQDLRRDAKLGLLGMGEAKGPPPVVQSGPLRKGVSVVFQWDTELGDYGRHYDAEEKEEADLIGLRADLDFACLLPPGAVAVGESWTVEPKQLRDLFAPCGSLPYDLSRRADPRLLRTLASGLAGELDGAFDGESRGGMTLNLREVREVEGRREAVVGLLPDFRVSSDLADKMQQRLAPGERAAGLVFIVASLVVEFEGEGELVWDLDAGRVLSLRLDLKERASQHLVQRTSSEDPLEMVQDIKLAGTFKTSMTSVPVEAPEAPGPRQH